MSIYLQELTFLGGADSAPPRGFMGAFYAVAVRVKINLFLTKDVFVWNWAVGLA